MAYSGEVRVDTRVTTDNIKKDLAKAEREIAKISKAFDSTTASVRKQEIALSDLQRKYDALMKGQKTPASLSAMQTSLRNTEREIREAEKANKDLFTQYEAAAGKAEALRPFGEADTQFIKAQEQADILFQRLEPVEQKFAELNAKAQDLRQSIAGIKMTPETSAEAQLLADKIQLTQEQLAQGQAEAAGLEQGIASATAEADRLRNALGESGGAESAKASIDGIGQAAQAAAQISTSAFKKIGSIIGGIAKGAGKAAKGVLGVVKNILTLGAGSRKASGGVNGLFKRLLQLGAAAFVFNVLRKGLRELSENMRNLLLANQDFAASWNAIKVNMLTAFAPMWEILEPAIVRFMELLAQFTAVLARFMAILFGKTYEQARDAAKAINDETEALKKLDKQAKKTTGALAQFDDISVRIQDTADEEKPGLDFDFTPPDASWIDEFAEKLKTLFTIPDPEYWGNLGATVAQWIADALNSVPWDKVQEWAKNFAINLASFLNGFLGNREMWESIGHTLAQGLNTALIFLYNFLTTLDFYKIASAIGHGINKFIDEFDWKLLGLTIAAAINGIFDFAAGLIDTVKWAQLGKSFADSFTALTDNIKWEQIGTTIKNGVKAILTTIDTALTGYDWGKLGKQFASLLNNALTDKSMWELAGKTLADGLNAAISYLLNFVRTFDWRGFGESIGAGINKFIQDVNWAELGAVIGEGIKGILGFLNSAIQEVDWQSVGRSIWEFLSEIDWSGIFKGFYELIGTIIGATVSLLWGFIKAAVSKIGEFFSSEIEAAGGNVALGLLNGILKGLANISAWIHENIFKPILDGIKKVFKIASPSKIMHDLGVFVIQGFLNGIKSLVGNVSKLFQDAWSGIRKVWGAVFKWFNDNVATPVRTAFDTALKNIIQFFTTAWSNISKAWSVVSKWFETNVIEPVKKAFDAALKNVQSIFSKSWDFIKNVWNVVKGWFETNVINPIKNAFDTALKAIQNFFKNAWTFIQGVWTTVSGWFSNTVINPVKSAFDNALKAVKDFFTSAWSGIQSIWKSASSWFNSTVIQPIKNAFSSAISSIKSLFTGLWNSISSIFKKIGDAISSLLSKISGVKSSAGSISVGSASSKSFGISPAAESVSPAASPAAPPAISGFSADALSPIFTPALGNIQIPQLSRGGIIDMATISMIAEKGSGQIPQASSSKDESLDMLSDVADLLREVKEAIQDFKDEFVNRPPATLSLDGDTITDMVDGEKRRRGMNFVTGAPI